MASRSASCSRRSAPAPSGSAQLGPDDGLALVGPLGIGFRAAGRRLRPLLVGGGIGAAPLLCLQEELDEATVLLGFRSAAHAQAAALFSGEPQVATDDGSVGRQALVTRAARGRARRGPAARPSSPAARPRCWRRCGRSAPSATCPRSSRSSPAWRAGSEPASDASCPPRTATCASAWTAPCWTPTAWRARCVAGAGATAWQGDPSSAACSLRGPVLNGSGTFDAIAARRAFGDALLERFPFDAFVSKTITLEPRQGNPPPRLWETPAGMINSIGLPNKGLDGFLASDLPELARAPRAAGGLGDGLQPRGARTRSWPRSASATRSRCWS